MTSGVTSIAKARSSAKRRADNKIVNDRTATFLMAVIGVLVVVGLGATMSASWIVGLDDGDQFGFVRQQSLALIIGIGLAIIASRVPYQWYQKLAVPIFLASVAGLVAVLMIGEVRAGAQRWITMGPIQMQPSELAKFGLVVMVAAVLTNKERRLDGFMDFAVPVGIPIGLVAALLLREPDFGTTLVVVAGAMTVVALSTAPLRYIAMMIAGGAGLASIFAVTASYRLARVSSFFSDNPDILGDGYQLDQSLKALGTGGMGGVGLGESRARWLFLPNAHTDFIFSIIGEEIGFIGAAFILVLFSVVSVLGLMIALRAPDRFGRLLAGGITAWIVAQAMINIGGVVGLLPISGIALPFVSYGGTALIMALGSVGVLVNVARQGRPGGLHATSKRKKK